MATDEYAHDGVAQPSASLRRTNAATAGGSINIQLLIRLTERAAATTMVVTTASRVVQTLF